MTTVVGMKLGLDGHWTITDSTVATPSGIMASGNKGYKCCDSQGYDLSSICPEKYMVDFVPIFNKFISMECFFVLTVKPNTAQRVSC